MTIQTTACVALLSVVVAGAAEAQLSVREGADVTLKIPASMLELEGTRAWARTPIYGVRIAPGGAEVTVNESPVWRTLAFPSMLALRVEKVDRKDDYTEVELRNDEVNVKLRFAREVEDLDAAFGQVVALGGPTDDAASTYRREAYTRIGARVFQGPLGQVTPEAQQLLLTYAHLTAEGTGLSHEQFRSQEYLAIDLGTDASIYNALQLNQAQRVAQILNTRLLNVLKAFADPVRDVEAIYGVKLELRIPHKSFLDQAALPDHDTMWLYAASADVQAFADFEITNQEFIDRCFVIVNENRIQVVL